MEFINVGSENDVKQNEMKAVNVGGHPVLLANLEGTYYAIGNLCTHMGCPLSKGTLKGENVECVCHGSLFSLKSGAIVRGPGSKAVRKYNVKVENGQIMISP